MFIDQDTVLLSQRQPRLFGQSAFRSNTHGHYHKIRLNLPFVRDDADSVFRLLKAGHRGIKPQIHSVGTQISVDLTCQIIINRGQNMLAALNDGRTKTSSD